jgi:acetylglutamate kinase
VSRVVLKLGGRVAAEAAATALGLRADGDEVVVVHGAGPQITAEMERRGIVPEFVDGRRVTTPEVIDVVRDALAAVNAEVSAVVEGAVPLMGDAIGLRARQMEGLGLVGDPEASAPPEVIEAIEDGGVPVVAPLASGPLNVNADEMAAALAVGIGADRIVFVTDVPGVYLDGEVLGRIAVDDVDRMLAEGVFEGGIVPKLVSAVRAARGGVTAEIGATAVVA